MKTSNISEQSPRDVLQNSYRLSACSILNGWCFGSLVTQRERERERERGKWLGATNLFHRIGSSRKNFVFHNISFELESRDACARSGEERVGGYKSSCTSANQSSNLRFDICVYHKSGIFFQWKVMFPSTARHLW
jgi:hypothetical protein